MRRLLRILLGAATIFSLLLGIATVAMWARSYWRYDGVSAREGTVWSESCEIYASPRFEAWHYYTGEAGSNGRIEVETGSKYRLWLPAWTWTYGSERLLAVQWWVVALAETAVFWLLWRRRGRREAGFPVETP